jgi:exonuclease SbcD
MPRFAHMSDLHIGAFRQPELRRLVLDAFEAAVDRCVAKNVSFVILAGDIFDSNVPDLASVSRAAAKIRQAMDAGVRFYAIYGSHDFSPNYSSMVDVLESAGLFRKAELLSSTEESVSLELVRDPSGPKICGISGRKLSIDADQYAMLDRNALEQEPGFKIFVFHGAIEELKPKSLEMMEAMPASRLPSGFEYYAGGHIHERSVKSLPGRKNVAYPGPLFATDYRELLEMARGQKRGFYLVDFEDDGVTSVEFEPVKVCDVLEVRYSAEGKPASRAERELIDLASRTDGKDKVTLLTLEGRLSEGRTSDIDFGLVRRRLKASGAIIVLQSDSRLTSPELQEQTVMLKPTQEVERETFKAGISAVKSEEGRLTGDQGVALALDLLKALKEAKKENENRAEFEERTTHAGYAVLGLKEEE